MWIQSLHSSSSAYTLERVMKVQERPRMAVDGDAAAVEDDVVVGREPRMLFFGGTVCIFRLSMNVLCMVVMFFCPRPLGVHA